MLNLTFKLWICISVLWQQILSLCRAHGYLRFLLSLWNPKDNVFEKKQFKYIFGSVWFRSCKFTTNYIETPKNHFFFEKYRRSYFILLAYRWMSSFHLPCPGYRNVHIYRNQTMALASKQKWSVRTKRMLFAGSHWKGTKKTGEGEEMRGNK